MVNSFLSMYWYEKLTVVVILITALFLMNVLIESFTRPVLIESQSPIDEKTTEIFASNATARANT